MNLSRPTIPPLKHYPFSQNVSSEFDGAKPCTQNELGIACAQFNKPSLAKRSADTNAQAGATMVEFALSAFLFFMFLMLGLDTIRFGYFALTTQYVLNRAARNAIVGTTAGSSHFEKDPQVRAAQIEQDIKTIALSFGMDLSGSTITICPLNSGPLDISCSPNNAGTPRDFIAIRIVRPFLFFWRGFQYNMEQYVVAKNEPF